MNYLSAVLLLVILALPFTILQPTSNLPEVHQAVTYSQTHRAMHWIVMKKIKDKAGCTAYAIGPHTLLTAEHCNIPLSKFYIDQPVENLETTSGISAEYFDHNDHMIIVLPHENFKDYIPYGYRHPVQGEPIHFWGNPKGSRDMYREGYCVGSMNLSDEDRDDPIGVSSDLDVFDVTTIAGDSGSAIFGADNRIVGIVTYGLDGDMLGASYPLHFTLEQIQEATK